MKKKLAIFCDGTWNDLRMADRTNVSRLVKCVAPAADDGTPQIVFYDEGVGVGSDVSRFVDEGVKFIGGALGRGLDRKIETAYRFLVTNYQPGDDIYIFGFSRGAYTARSLCGLIRKCGILKRDCFDQTPQALDRYRNALHPSDPKMQDFRKQYAHPVAAGLEDHDRLGLPEESPPRHATPETLADLYQYRSDHTYRMMFVGLWDTVGSLGLPDRAPLLSKALNRKYDFHDTQTSGLIASLRHAVSIDEDRKVFSSTPVSNVEELNRLWASRTGWSVDPPVDARFVPYDFRPYQEIWFPGDHGAVGGGNPEPGLSSTTLLWIAEGAERAGLKLVHAGGNELGRAAGLANPCAEWRVNKDGTPKKGAGRDFLGRVGGFRPRKGPVTIDAVGTSAWERWCRDPEYRPDNLSVMTGRPCPQPPAAPSPAGFPTR